MDDVGVAHVDQRRLRAGEGSTPANVERWSFDPLVMSPRLRRALRGGASADELHEVAIQDGYRASSSLADGDHGSGSS